VIVVLALPEIVTRLHTSISHVTWVITAYNLALIVTASAVIPFARRSDSTRALIAGLGLFALASIGCGLADSMSALVPFRCLQGVGGGLLLCVAADVRGDGAAGRLTAERLVGGGRDRHGGGSRAGRHPHPGLRLARDLPRSSAGGRAHSP